jgi:hypothetical protein
MKVKVITTDLKKQPDMLPKSLWKLLRSFSLARTPHEERVHLFFKSEKIEIDEGPFCVGIIRALKASLSLDPRMEDIKVQFVKGGKTEIDLLFRKEENLLRIHEKWVNFQGIHEVASCEIFRLTRGRPGEMEAFLCDHVVEDLFELALDNIRGPLDLGQAECVAIRRVARERIRQMPRLIKVSQTGLANELEVSWIGNESGIVSKTYGADIQYHVTLHKMSTCGSKRNQLLYHIGKCNCVGGVAHIL